MKKTEIEILILIITIVGIFSIQEIHAQIDPTPPCIEEIDRELEEASFRNLTKESMSDWELIHFITQCNVPGIAASQYRLPNYSPGNYFVSVSGLIPEKGNLETEKFLKERNQIVSDSITKLHSTKAFQEIDKHFDSKKISFFYGKSNFSIIASNYPPSAASKVSEFEIDVDNGKIRNLELTNDIEIEYFTEVQMARKQAEQILSNSTCSIMLCNEYFCGKTSLGRSAGPVYEKPRGLYAAVSIEGEQCPKSIIVEYTPDLLIKDVYPYTKGQFNVMLPPKVEQEEAVLELIEQEKGPLDEMTDIEAKELREAMKQLKQEEKLRTELIVLIPVILGLVGIGFLIMLIKHKRKIN